MRTKKLLLPILTLVIFTALCSCASDDTSSSEELVVYSFNGANDRFTITNGVIVLNATEEVFYGGNLDVTQDGLFSDIASFSTTFYTMADGEKKIILSNTVTDMTENPVDVTGDLGKISGAEALVGAKFDDAQELQSNLYFEMITTDLNGEEKTYHLQLSLTGVTDEK